MEDLKEETFDYGICLIDVYCAPGDLYDSWDIVTQNPIGRFSRLPNAGYGPDAIDRDVKAMQFEPVRIQEVCRTWDQNGHQYSETIIFADGKMIASRRH